jgi:GT2 family glycosyltransferase
MIAVVIITHNRRAALQQCVENVIGSASFATTEVVIWNNGSTDGTAEYLDGLRDSRILVVHSPVNVGMNGYARGFALTTAPFLVELDDDIVDAPQDWDATMLDAFERLPDIGFLAADLSDDPKDHASYVRHHVRPDEYQPYEVNGVRLLTGPAGGGCAMTSREICERVGGFPERPGETFWQEEWEYQVKLAEQGYGGAVLQDVVVTHRGGTHYNYQSPDKIAFWERYERRARRKDIVKRCLLLIPAVRPLNRRFGFFVEPKEGIRD